MATKTILVCDKCGSDEDVRARFIRLDVEDVEIHLCAKDRQPLDELAVLGRRVAGGLVAGVDRLKYLVVPG